MPIRLYIKVVYSHSLDCFNLTYCNCFSKISISCIGLFYLHFQYIPPRSLMNLVPARSCQKTNEQL